MKKIFFTTSAAALLLITGCNKNDKTFDAAGTFEADETIVSSELSGKILTLNVSEGAMLAKDSVVGTVDAANVSLQQQQVEASINALNEKTADAGPQIQLLQNQLAVQQSQLNNLLHEKTRMENLVKSDAATGKQLDDINSQVEVAAKQMNVTKKQTRLGKEQHN
jgi:HlyD family secretion protein